MADINPLSEEQRHYLAPGVYWRSRHTARKHLRLVRTDVAGFIGYAERGPLPSDPVGVKGLLPPSSGANGDIKRMAVRVTSWKEYRAIFGGFTHYSAMPYAVRAFFENGGSTCHIVRIAATDHPNNSQRPRFASFALPSVLSAKFIEPELSRLAQDANPGDWDLFLDSPFVVAGGDLLEVVGKTKDGLVTELGIVTNQELGQIRLARPLSAQLNREQVSLTKFSPALVISATSSGNWGNRIELTLTPFASGSDEFSLRVSIQPGLDRSQELEDEFYRHLSLDADSQFYAENLINGFSKLIRVEVKSDSLVRADGTMALFAANADSPNASQFDLRSRSVRLVGGQDGLSGLTFRDFIGGPGDTRGLRLLEEVDEVAILCAPDVVCEPFQLPKRRLPRRDPCEPGEEPAPEPVAEDGTARPPSLGDVKVVEIYRAMIDQCERLRDRVAILDTPIPPRTAGQLESWRNQFTTRFAALYYPWLKVPDALSFEGQTRTMPPSGHVAGIYARIDNQFGVHRPPANVQLKFVTDVTEEISALQQEYLNPYGINAIRAFAGRGIRVWGARSLADIKTDRDWQFIHVRRLMSMIEESVDDSMQWAVFEPNDETLRRTLLHSLSVFLETIWRQGGLKGAVPAEGFFVKCDETNNPPAVVDSGQLVCQIGVAVAAPMEFIIFEMRQQPSGTQIVEP